MTNSQTHSLPKASTCCPAQGQYAPPACGFPQERMAKPAAAPLLMRGAKSKPPDCAPAQSGVKHARKFRVIKSLRYALVPNPNFCAVPRFSWRTVPRQFWRQHAAPGAYTSFLYANKNCRLHILPPPGKSSGFRQMCHCPRPSRHKRLDRAMVIIRSKHAQFGWRGGTHRFRLLQTETSPRFELSHCVKTAFASASPIFTQLLRNILYAMNTAMNLYAL
jgi:hypothetical protein